MVRNLDQILKRKEKLLDENPEFKRAEGLLHQNTGKYIGDLIYGANDGLITTFAIVASAAGAGLPNLVVLFLGLANITADAISMGASNYLGGKSEADFARQQKKKKHWEIKNFKELEVEEIREIFEKKGFKNKDLDRAVEIISSDEKVWLETMMVDKLGILEPEDKPIKPALATFFSFLIVGMIPLLAFLIPGISNPFLIAVVLSGITLFIVGALRSFVTTVSFIRGGLEMFIIGCSAGGIAYFVGTFVENFIK